MCWISASTRGNDECSFVQCERTRICENVTCLSVHIPTGRINRLNRNDGMMLSTDYCTGRKYMIRCRQSELFNSLLLYVNCAARLAAARWSRWGNCIANGVRHVSITRLRRNVTIPVETKHTVSECNDSYWNETCCIETGRDETWWPSMFMTILCQLCIHETHDDLEVVLHYF